MFSFFPWYQGVLFLFTQPLFQLFVTLLHLNEQELPGNRPGRQQQQCRIFVGELIECCQRQNIKNCGWCTLQDPLKNDIYRAILSPTRRSFDTRLQNLYGYYGDYADNGAAKPVEEIREKL